VWNQVGRELEQLRETRVAEEQDIANKAWSRVGQHKKQRTQLEASLAHAAQEILDAIECHALLYVGPDDDAVCTRLRLEALRSHSLVALAELAASPKRKQLGMGWRMGQGGLCGVIMPFFIMGLRGSFYGDQKRRQNRALE